MFIRRKWLRTSIFWLLPLLIFLMLQYVLPSPIGSWLRPCSNVTPFVLFVLLACFTLRQSQRSQQISSSSKNLPLLSLSKGQKVTFADIAGIDRVRRELQEIV